MNDRIEAFGGGYDGHIGVEIVSLAKDRIIGELQAGPQHLTVTGRVHGGVLMSLADTLGAQGAIQNLPPGCSTTTLESKTNFLRGAFPGVLIGESVPLHIGRSTMVWQTTIRTATGDRVAVITQTQMVLQPRAEATTDAPPPAIAVKNGVAENAGNGEEPRSDVAATRRAQVFRAACDVIARKGFDRATMREIAAAAGMPVPTMYQYLRSKDDLLALIFDTYLGEIKAKVSVAVSEAGSPTAKLRAAIGANLASFDTYHSQIRLMNRETKSLAPEVRRRVIGQMISYIQLFRDVIAEGIESGEFRRRDPELLANLILILCEVWPLRHWSVGKFGLEGVERAILDLVLDGTRQPGKGKS